MPNRIGFHVIYATSEVTQHPASELGWAGPASRGWRSAPGAHAPHDLVLQLATRVNITRVQFLAHHYLIPKRIELLVHDSTGGEGVARTPSSPQYEAVGWIALTEGGGAARELKTVSVPQRPAAYLRLRLSEPHENEKNAYNQVALMGVNVFGNLIEAEDSSSKSSSTSDLNVTNDVYSPYDDLAFIMYVDNDIADIIRQLEFKKQSAVLAERFEYARKLKVACDVLGTGGRVIGGWQLQKRVAAAAEQYERATRRRDAITIGRARIMEAINYETIIETNGIDPKNDEYGGDEKPFSAEMLIQCTSHLSFDSPSPPTVMQSLSTKNNEDNNLNSNEIVIDDNNIYINNLQNKVLEEFVNNNDSVKQNYLPETSEKSNKIHFDEHLVNQTGSTDNLNHVTKKNIVEVYNNKMKNECSTPRLEGSYFNSPANSVSPTNLPYNGEICRNGSPASSHKNSPATPQYTAVVKRRNRSAGPPPPAHHRSSYEAYEERLVPTLRHSHTNEYLRGYQTEQTEPKGKPRMPERERKQAALPILIFGEDLVEKIYSKHFAEKEDGLLHLKNQLRSFDAKPSSGPAILSPNKAARAAALLLHRALRDPVFSVYSAAAELTRVFFTEFVAGRVNGAEIGRSVERLVPELLTRAGDPAPRVHSLAMHTLLSMADCPPVRSLNLIPSYLVRPLTAGTAPRLALSRLLMVEQLLLNHGIDKNSGLKARAVAELGAGGLTHGQGAVRRAAERLLLAAYERAPRLVRGQLPPDDPVTRRNLLYRHLFEGFDRIDRRKQEETLGISQCEEASTTKIFESDMMMMESMTTSQMTHSMSSSMGSSMTGSLYQPKSSMKKQSSKKVSNVGFNGIKNDHEYPGYNKLRLDSAVSPKHQPKINKTAQNPRNYVLEKNWQNSIQNGHYDEAKEKAKEAQTVNAIFHKNTIMARNLHSSIMFDNKTSYSDGENVNFKELNISDSKKTSSDTIKSHNGILDSPGGTLKRNKNIKNSIFRSKSGSNVPTCFDDNNYDSFDDSQFEIYEYSRGSKDDIKNIAEDAKENYESGTSTPEAQQTNDESGQCPFCFAKVSDGGLDIHYWKTCPLLCRCTACRAPLEIRVFSQHLTEDCPHSNDYRYCPRCSEAIETEYYQQHIANNDCLETAVNCWKCPLCHKNVPGDDDSWRCHLSADGDFEEPCTMNPRASSLRLN